MIGLEVTAVEDDFTGQHECVLVTPTKKSVDHENKQTNKQTNIHTNKQYPSRLNCQLLDRRRWSAEGTGVPCSSKKYPG